MSQFRTTCRHFYGRGRTFFRRGLANRGTHLHDHSSVRSEAKPLPQVPMVGSRQRPRESSTRFEARVQFIFPPACHPRGMPPGCNPSSGVDPVAFGRSMESGEAVPKKHPAGFGGPNRVFSKTRGATSQSQLGSRGLSSQINVRLWPSHSWRVLGSRTRR